ncbi:MAG: DUF3307 domain-containing protein [Muribaculaceae bacterium]|nr:DUF3307 domain-containing protein [Muribaculaceae bacterium]
MIAILFGFIAAHLIGDFILQSDKNAQLKFTAELPKKVEILTVHSALQALLTYVFIAQWSAWPIPVIILLSHFAIDFFKVQSGKRGLPAFLCDQFAHYVVIAVVWWAFFVRGVYPVAVHPLAASFLIKACAFIAVLVPVSVFIKLFLEYEKWIPNEPSLQGMPNAGRWIGFLERVLILTFIFSNNIDGIGFLLAAKSIFRFGELRRSKDVKVTEYVLIGTLLSFAAAILIGFGAEWISSINNELV